MWPALIAAGASAIGGIISNKQTDARQKDAQKFNEQQARQQMDFQERMSGTAYQRGMEDMRKAGLNPMLAYSQGGASSPTGAMASSTYSPATDVITPAVSSATQVSRAKAEIANLVATNANIAEQNKNLQAQRVQIGSQVQSLNADTQIKLQAIEQATALAKRGATDQQFYDSPIGKAARWLGLLSQEAGWISPKMQYHRSNDLYKGPSSDFTIRSK